MSDSNITKRALAQAMKDLMVQHPFSKISVGDVCQVCSMNRKSFYYHFRDKQDLVNWIFYSEFIENLQIEGEVTGWMLLSRICDYFYRERVFYRKALAIDGQNSFREYFMETMRPFVEAFTLELSGGRPVENPQLYMDFFSDAVLSSIIRWLSAPAPYDPETYLRRIRTLLVALAKSIYRYMPEEFEPSDGESGASPGAQPGK